MLRELVTCNTQQDSSERHPPTHPCLPQEDEHVIWRKCLVHLRVPVKYIVQAKRTDAQQPRQYYWRKEKPDPMGAIVLKSKQTH